jgi:hypothetical protein
MMELIKASNFDPREAHIAAILVRDSMTSRPLDKDVMTLDQITKMLIREIKKMSPEQKKEIRDILNKQFPPKKGLR